jgi:hypothetical protein
MKYYTTTSAAEAWTLAGRLADLEKGKARFAIWEGPESCATFNEKGQRDSVQALPVHSDAVQIWESMTDDELKNAKRMASARETVRAKENSAADLLQALQAGPITDTFRAGIRARLLALVNVAYHDSGKIEGCSSVDGCASCEFCQRMIAAAADNDLMICGCCYAAADAWKEIAWRTHSLNARILSSVLFTLEELATLRLTERCRFNEDGDTVNETHARNLLRIVVTHPGTFCGYWFKNGPAVAAGLAAEGYKTREDLPANVRFIHSSALIGFPARPLWFDDGIFTVFPDQETTDAAIAAGAWECNGRRCRACGYFCYMHDRRPEPVHIAELLRTNKQNRARIRAAYDARKALQDSASA